MGRRSAAYGLRNAVARHEQALGAQIAEGVYASTAEAVMWACAIDETFWNDPHYAPHRDADPDGFVINGLRFARNQAIHQLVALHRWNKGMTFPLTFPLQFFSVTWLPRSALPDPKFEVPAQMTAYDERLAGKQVKLSLQAALRFFHLDGPPRDARHPYRLPGTATPGEHDEAR